MNSLLGFLSVVSTLWTSYSIRAQTNTPRVPIIHKLAGCTVSDAILYYLHINMEECTENCVRQTECQSINYNRRSTLCILKNTEIEPVSEGYCNHIVLRDLNYTILPKSDPCSMRSCNKQSVCESSDLNGNFTCKLLYCDSDKLPNMPNARIMSRFPTRINSTNAYACFSGYTMFGDSMVQCLSNGSWTSADFTCYKDCPRNILKIGASVLGWTRMRFTFNTTVTYSCNTNYYTFVEPKIICDKNGNWSQFECFRHCFQADTPQLENGVAIVGGTNYTVNDRVRYTCNQGYYMSPGSDSVACQSDGTWEQLGTVCWKYCETPTGPTNTILVQQAPSTYTKDMTLTFVCSPSNEYYADSDVTTTSCKSDGTWTTLSFNCNKYCGQPPLDEGLFDGLFYLEVVSGGGLDKYTDGHSVTYKCKYTSYLGGGNDRRVCNKDGHWSGSITCCIPFLCCTDSRCSADLRG